MNPFFLLIYTLSAYVAFLAIERMLNTAMAVADWWSNRKKP